MSANETVHWACDFFTPERRKPRSKYSLDSILFSRDYRRSLLRSATYRFAIGWHSVLSPRLWILYNSFFLLPYEQSIPSEIVITHTRVHPRADLFSPTHSNPLEFRSNFAANNEFRRLHGASSSAFAFVRNLPVHSWSKSSSDSPRNSSFDSFEPCSRSLAWRA